MSLSSYALSTGSESLNVSNTSFSHLPTKVSQLHNLHIFIYLHNFISVQRLRSTRSSSIVTLAQTLSSSFLKITDHSFRYALSCLWNQLPLFFYQSYSGTNFSISDSLYPSIFFDLRLCSSITPSLFHSRLKPTCFSSPTPVVSLLPPDLPLRTIARTVSSELLSFCFLFFSYFLFMCCVLD